MRTFCKNYCLTIPVKELNFNWYNNIGQPCDYPPENNWLFKVSGTSFKMEEVVRVELPTLDYRSNNCNPTAKIYIEHFYEGVEEGEWDVYENIEE